MSRFLDWIDEAAGGLIRILYLAWGIAAVASYFGAGDMPPALNLALVTVAPWLIAAALETHTYLTARRVRAAWQQKDDRSLKVNLAILFGLLAFSMLNQLQYLGETWRPPQTQLALPGIWAYALRALVVPAAFMAAAFLAPVGESLSAKVQAEAHRFADATFKVARKQWRTRLEEMAKLNQDVTGALVQLVDDPDERRVIETIHTAMYPALPALPAPDFPTGGGSPSAQPRPAAAAERSDDRPAVLRLTPASGDRRAAPHAAAKGTHPRRVRTATVERQVRAAYRDGMTVGQLQRFAGISRSAAGKWRKVLRAESAQEVAQ